VLANIFTYDAGSANNYIDSAPHIKHAALRLLYTKLLIQVFDFARKYTDTPQVLDLGAGEGLLTLSFLELGAHVTAVDISSIQLDALQNKCERFKNMLEVRCEDINDTLRDKSNKYDIIAATSFLHHVPDYIGMIKKSLEILAPYGQFFSFQDPLRYDSCGRFTIAFSNLAYFSWRIFMGDVIGGFKRRLRRRRGVYLADSVHDNAEYHITRNGVDQDAIYGFFKTHGFDCDVLSYFSTQNSAFQHLGAIMGIRNTFAVIVRKQQ
jgi:SAM-dependent methyltransferase